MNIIIKIDDEEFNIGQQVYVHKVLFRRVNSKNSNPINRKNNMNYTLTLNDVENDMIPVEIKAPLLMFKRNEGLYGEFAEFEKEHYQNYYIKALNKYKKLQTII